MTTPPELSADDDSAHESMDGMSSTAELVLGLLWALAALMAVHVVWRFALMGVDLVMQFLDQGSAGHIP